MTGTRPPIQKTISFSNSQGESVRGTLMTLTRTTVVMEVYNPYSIVQLSEVLEDLTIHRNQKMVYQGKAVVNNLVNTGLMLIVSATLVDTWKDMRGIGMAQGIAEETTQFVEDWSKTQNLYSGYQLIVGNIRSFLYELNLWMEQTGLYSDQQGQIGSLSEQEVLEHLADSVLPKMQELFTRFELEAKKVSGDDLMMHKMYAQHDLHPLLMRSPFVHRTFTKPLGYAGDYEMVNMMTRSGWEGPTTYAKLVNYFHILAGPAEAHRNRLSILYGRLKELSLKAQANGSRVRILNIACGPALEIQRFLDNEPSADHCEFHLLDFNQTTLDYTRNRLESISTDNQRCATIEYIHESVHKLLKKAHADEIDLGESSYDLVYCAGLFDYLSDRVCSRLLKLFHRLAKPDGLVLATNVDPSNESISLMEHLLEWYLIYRSEEHLESLARGLGETRVYSDETGMNVFLEIRNVDH